MEDTELGVADAAAGGSVHIGNGAAPAAASEAPQDPEAVRAMAAKVGLDEARVAEELARISPVAQAKALADFAMPAEGVRDTLAFFRGFLRRQQFLADAEGWVELQARWSLNGASGDKFAGLTKKVQREVLAQFDPPADTKDMNGLFVKFCDKCARARTSAADAKGKGADGAYGDRQIRWRPTQPASKAMAVGAVPARGGPGPPPLSAAAAIGGPVGGPHAGGKPVHGAGLDGPHGVGPGAKPVLVSGGIDAGVHSCIGGGPPTPPGRAAGIIVGQAVREPPGLGTDDTLDEGPNNVEAFVARWGLKEDTVAMLAALPPIVRSAVLVGFMAGPGTRDAGARLAAYVAKVSRINAESSAVPVAGLVTSDKAASSPANIEAFVHRWNLDEQSEALLRSLPPGDSDKIMQRFAPEEDVRNVNAKFTAFVRRAAPGPRTTPDSANWYAVAGRDGAPANAVRARTRAAEKDNRPRSSTPSQWMPRSSSAPRGGATARSLGGVTAAAPARGGWGNGRGGYEAGAAGDAAPIGWDRAAGDRGNRRSPSGGSGPAGTGRCFPLPPGSAAAQAGARERHTDDDGGWHPTLPSATSGAPGRGVLDAA